MSHEKFEVGEIAILCNCKKPEHEGLEVTILSSLVLEDIRGRGPRWVYKLDIIEASTRINYHAEPHQLRKRRPPMDPAFVKWRDQLVKEFAMDGGCHV